jgi:hypothetical protein
MEDPILSSQTKKPVITVGMSPKVKSKDGVNLKALMAEIQVLIKCYGTLPTDLERAFRDIDKDNSGGVDREEFREAMRNLGVPMGVSEVEALFKYYDEDQNGFLDVEEFKALFSGSRSLDNLLVEMTESHDNESEGDGTRIARTSILEMKGVYKAEFDAFDERDMSKSVFQNRRYQNKDLKNVFPAGFLGSSSRAIDINLPTALVKDIDIEPPSSSEIENESISTLESSKIILEKKKLPYRLTNWTKGSSFCDTDNGNDDDDDGVVLDSYAKVAGKFESIRNMKKGHRPKVNRPSLFEIKLGNSLPPVTRAFGSSKVKTEKENGKNKVKIALKNVKLSSNASVNSEMSAMRSLGLVPSQIRHSGIISDSESGKNYFEDHHSFLFEPSQQSLNEDASALSYEEFLSARELADEWEKEKHQPIGVAVSTRSNFTDSLSMLPTSFTMPMSQSTALLVTSMATMPQYILIEILCYEDMLFCGDASLPLEASTILQVDPDFPHSKLTRLINDCFTMRMVSMSNEACRGRGTVWSGKIGYYMPSVGTWKPIDSSTAWEQAKLASLQSGEVIKVCYYLMSSAYANTVAVGTDNSVLPTISMEILQKKEDSPKSSRPVASSSQHMLYPTRPTVKLSKLKEDNSIKGRKQQELAEILERSLVRTRW